MTQAKISYFYISLQYIIECCTRIALGVGLSDEPVVWEQADINEFGDRHLVSLIRPGRIQCIEMSATDLD